MLDTMATELGSATTMRLLLSALEEGDKDQKEVWKACSIVVVADHRVAASQGSMQYVSLPS